MYSRVTWFRVVLAAFILAALSAPAFAQHSEIERAAPELAKSLYAKYGHELGKTRVAVIPFARFHGHINELGIVLADELAQSLSKQGKNLEVIDNKQLTDFMKDRKSVV